MVVYMDPLGEESLTPQPLKQVLVSTLGFAPLAVAAAPCLSRRESTGH